MGIFSPSIPTPPPPPPIPPAANPPTYANAQAMAGAARRGQAKTFAGTDLTTGQQQQEKMTTAAEGLGGTLAKIGTAV